MKRSRLYFHEGYFTREIRENFVPRKLLPIRYVLIYSHGLDYMIMIKILNTYVCSCQIKEGG